MRIIWFGVGLLAGGVTSACGLWLLSGLTAWLVPAVTTATILILAAAAILRDAKVVSFPLPQNARQVPITILERSARRAGLQFGFELGTGMRTYVTTTAPYVLACALLTIIESPLTAFAVGAGFGAGRFLMPLARYMSLSGGRWDELLERRGALMLPVVSIAATILVAGLAVYA